MPSVVLITLLLATTAPETTAPVGQVPAGVDADITVSPAVDDDASDVMAAEAVAPEPRKVSGPAVVDNVLLRGAIAGGTGLVVGYGVGLITAFGGAFTIFQPQIGVPAAILTLGLLVGGVGGVETILHAFNGGTWNDVAIHLAVVAGVSLVVFAVAAGVFLVNPGLTTLGAVPMAVGAAAGLTQMALVFIDLSTSQISEPPSELPAL